MNSDDEEDYAVLYDDIGYALVLWNVKISDKVLPDAKPVSFSYLSRLLPGDGDSLKASQRLLCKLTKD